MSRLLNEINTQIDSHKRHGSFAAETALRLLKRKLERCEFYELDVEECGDLEARAIRLRENVRRIQFAISGNRKWNADDNLARARAAMRGKNGTQKRGHRTATTNKRRPAGARAGRRASRAHAARN